VVTVAARERAGWEYQAGQAEAQDILGMTDADAQSALEALEALGRVAK
jgi:hypothetical protein